MSARTGAFEYRFDGLADGVYEVELRFAEIDNQRAGNRIFDVSAEGGLLLFGYDIAAAVGQNRAHDHTFLVPVSDGQLNLEFIARRGLRDPLVNAIRVTHRPDQ